MPPRDFCKTAKQKEATRLAADHKHLLMAGGSRSGKSLLAVYLTIIRAAKCPNSRHLIVRQIMRDAVQKIGMDTFPTVCRIAFPELPMKLSKAPWYWTLPNGSEIWLGGLDDAGDRDARILGSEYSTISYEECDQMAYESILLARTRLAQLNSLTNREFFTCNPPPKSSWVYRLFVENIDPIDRKPVKNVDEYARILMNPADNIQNIDPDYIAQLEALPQKQRDRFLHGLWGNDSQTVLFSREWFGDHRVDDIPVDEDGEPDVTQVVIGLDPAGTGNRKSDETGIAVDALGRNGEAYVLHTESLQVPPDVWAARVCELYNLWGCNTVVAEVNFGADMVKSVIKNVNPSVHVTPVRASRGKAVRAEPVAALYELGKVHHVGAHDQLEDELMMYDMVAPPKISPGVGDAQVWAVTHLLGGNIIRPTVSTETGGRQENGDGAPKNLEDMSIPEIIDQEELWEDL